MRSRVVRLVVGSIALLAFGGFGFFLFKTEPQLAASRAKTRAFEQQARETREILGDLRAAQQAYVAAGQGRDFWMPKVESNRDAAVSKTTALRRAAGSAEAGAALDRVSAAIAAFADIDTRVREYLASGQDLMAADVVFTEGHAAAADALNGIEAARAAEQGALERSEADIRDQQLYALAGAGGLGALVILLLAFSGAQTRAEEGDGTLNLHEAAAAQARPRDQARLLKATAELCTDFGRLRSIDELNALLGKTAATMDASGVVVWLGSPAGADLRPVLAHGYPAATLARMPSVPRNANNAAAAAYRSGMLQIVLSKPGGEAGAIVAPILSADGCIGALSIEIKGGSETSDAVQAMAGIIAAQLAGVLAASATDARTGDDRAAAQA
jgi:hypothetical protein